MPLPPPDRELLNSITPLASLVFAGAARELISADRAAQVRDALRALQASAEGDHARIDNLFSDLVNREPTLPPHLQAQLEQHNKGDKE